MLPIYGATKLHMELAQSIMEIHKSTMELHKSFMELHNYYEITNRYSALYSTPIGFHKSINAAT